jgi:hypothetical protein
MFREILTGHLVPALLCGTYTKCWDCYATRKARNPKRQAAEVARRGGDVPDVFAQTNAV